MVALALLALRDDGRCHRVELQLRELDWLDLDLAGRQMPMGTRAHYPSEFARPLCVTCRQFRLADLRDERKHADEIDLGVVAPVIASRDASAMRTYVPLLTPRCRIVDTEMAVSGVMPHRRPSPEMADLLRRRGIADLAP